MEFSIKVAVRVRPLLPRDKVHYPNIPFEVNTYTNQIIVGNQSIFNLNHVLPLNCTQSQLFDFTIYPLINSVLEGQDVSIIMYGQSNSGKSYTLVGPGLHCAYSETEYGIIPRTTRIIFNRLLQYPNKKFRITVSFIELTSAGIYDLLNTSYYKNEIFVSFNEKGSVILSGAEEIECQSISEVFNCLHVGMSNKEVASMNHQSCKSHTIFTLKIEEHWLIDGIKQYRYSKIQFTDLAGSERCYLNTNTGEIIQEPGLISLNNVINTLADSYNQAFVPYTHSLLTRFLKDSFGGRSLTLVICCISPYSFDLNETLNSLRFVERLRLIKNYARVNSSLSIEDNQKFNSTDSQQQSENNTNGDTFGLEFAASQWLKLVSNAENLFSKLVSSECLEERDKDQIQQWLCLKQECEECVVSDETISLKHYNGRILDRIEELTESEDKSIPSQQTKSIKGDEEEAESSNAKSESESDIEHLRPDFLDKLFDFIEKFKIKTDININKTKDKFVSKLPIKENIVKVSSDSNIETPSVSVATKPYQRRKSIHPGMENPWTLKQANNISPLSEISTKISSLKKLEENVNIINNEGRQSENLKDTKSDILHSLDKSVNTDNMLSRSFVDSQTQSSIVDENEELKNLTLTIETRQNEITKLQTNLNAAEKRIEHLNYTIQIKEQFIEAMAKNSKARSEAKEKFRNKLSKLQMDYYNIEVYLRKYSDSIDDKYKYQKEIEKIEKKIKEIEVIIQTLNESAKTILELENSLEYSKKQLDKLRSYIKKEEKNKSLLEQQLLDDKKKMKDLCKEYNLESESEENKPKNGNKSVLSNKDEQLILNSSNKSIKKKRLKDSSSQISLDKKENSTIIENTCKMEEQIICKKILNLENFQEIDEKDTLRDEIAQLRIIKDFLVDLSCEKKSKEKNLTDSEEHYLIEYEEAIGAIDAAIEFKNELICGRTNDAFQLSNLEEWQKKFIDCLINLRPMELSILFWKYFQKVIDLRENGRKMESQLVEADHQNEIEIRALNNALEDLKFVNDKKMDLMQIEFQDKIHLIVKQFNEQSTGSSGNEVIKSLVPEEENEFKQMKRENRRLRKRLQDVEHFIHVNKINPQSRSTCQLTIPPQHIKTLKGISPPPTTKVTRQKNKLIIQQSSNKKL